MNWTKEEWIKNGKNGIHTKDGTCIATTHNEDHKEEDAYLISASPEMYEALEYAYDIINERKFPICKNVMNIALKKARGEL